MKNKTGKKVLYYAILAILLGVFCFSGYQIYSYYSEQNASKSLNQEIVREYTIRKTGEAKEFFEVDFDQLRQQNEDVTAWLYLPDSVINYPVLQHGDNDYYLTRQIDGSYNKNGSIFMDYRNASDFSDRNTIIYGHHMRTGNMFGKLVNFKSDSYYQQHDHMFIMTPQVTYRLELLCGQRALEYLSLSWQQNSAVGRELSVKPDKTAQAVERLLGEVQSLKARCAGLEEAEFHRLAEEHRGAGNVLLVQPPMEPDSVRRLCDAVSRTCSGRCAVFAGTDGGYKYAVIHPEQDITPFTKAMNAALRGRGGGRDGFAQGSAACTEEEIRRFWAENT